VGARERDIYVQFVVESGLLASGGALGGLALGVLVTLVASALGPWPLALSWGAAWLAALASAAVGVGAGLLPARRAARLEPASAVRGGVA